MMRVFLFIVTLSLLFNQTGAQVVTGVYRGNMEVDSPKNTINFELILKERKGKITGYCYRLFIKGDTVYYNLLKVSGRVSNKILIVEDERSVSNNFEVSTRGIKTRFFFKLDDIADTADVLPGTWETSFWKNYMPLKGTITVIREKKHKETQLYSRLKDLDLADEMNFDSESDAEIIAKNNKSSNEKNKEKELAKDKKTKPSSKADESITKTKEKAEISGNINNMNPGVGNQTIKPATVPNTIAIKERKSEPVTTQTYAIYEDSITLSIYDNGEIDGDTVSVFLNDVRIVEKIGLTARAFKINIPVEKTKVNKIELFAENLGKIPPNTGLLEIYSGEKRYQIFFSATLEKNAVIYLERKE